MPSEVWLIQNGDSIYVGTVEEIQGLFGSDYVEKRESYEGKVLIGTILSAVNDAMEMVLLGDSDETIRIKIT